MTRMGAAACGRSAKAMRAAARTTRRRGLMGGPPGRAILSHSAVLRGVRPEVSLTGSVARGAIDETDQGRGFRHHGDFTAAISPGHCGRHGCQPAVVHPTPLRRRRRATSSGTRASARLARRGPTSELRRASGLPARGGGRRGSVARGSGQEGVSGCARLPGLARAAEEGTPQPRLDQRLDAGPHACDRGDGRDASGTARVLSEAAVRDHPRGPQADGVCQEPSRAHTDGHPGFVDALAAHSGSDCPERRDWQSEGSACLLRKRAGATRA